MLCEMPGLQNFGHREGLFSIPPYMATGRDSNIRREIKIHARHCGSERDENLFHVLLLRLSEIIFSNKALYNF